MRLLALLTGYIADLRDSTGRRRSLLIAGGVFVAAMACWDVYMVASGAVPVFVALAALPIAGAAGRSAASAYRRHHLKR